MIKIVVIRETSYQNPVPQYDVSVGEAVRFELAPYPRRECGCFNTVDMTWRFLDPVDLSNVTHSNICHNNGNRIDKNKQCFV